MHRLVGLVCVVALSACSLTTNLDALQGDGGSGDAWIAPDGPTSAPGFKISVAPGTVKLGPGIGDVVTVDVTRIDGFADPVTITVNGLPANVNASPLQVTGVGGSINMGSSGAKAGEYDVTVVGTSGAQVSTAPLHVHVGGILQVVTANGTVKIPPGNPKVFVKLWGGGGGGGKGTFAGVGGGGGYAEDAIDVTAGETLDVDVGTGGKPSNSGGAGGGGYSAIRRGITILVQAGGGGGAAGGLGSSLFGGAGGAGGGLTGQNGAAGGNGFNGGSGGTQSGGQALNLGGNAGNDGPAGIPGGGMGEGNNGGGGGGGGGKWGGQEGSNGNNGGANPRGGSGGGGGSALVGPAGKAVTGVGSQPGSALDPDCLNAGAGGAVGVAGGDGKVIVYLP